MEYSPAMSPRSDFSDMDDEALDLYLATCVPLSNLPTPPPAKEQPFPASLPTPPLDASDLQHRSPELEVYATHLTNLVPRNVSSRTPDVAAIRGFLGKARLPVEVVAYAGCVLDALSSQFGGVWREACGRSKPSACDFYVGYNVWQRSTASPDLVVLSALALAHGFIDDGGRSNSHWAKVEGEGRFSAKELDMTKMCILKDIDYGLFQISEEMVQSKVRDLQRACDFACPTPSFARKDSVANPKDERRPRLSLSTSTSGIAVWVHGVHTPEPSP